MGKIKRFLRNRSVRFVFVLYLLTYLIIFHTFDRNYSKYFGQYPMGTYLFLIRESIPVLTTGRFRLTIHTRRAQQIL